MELSSSENRCFLYETKRHENGCFCPEGHKGYQICILADDEWHVRVTRISYTLEFGSGFFDEAK